MRELKNYMGNFPKTSPSRISKLINFYSGFPRSSHSPADRLAADPSQVCKYYEDLSSRLKRRAEMLRRDNPDINIWESIDLGRNELKHCSILAWLIDCNGDHKQGGLFLRCLCGVMGFDEIVQYIESEEYQVKKEQVDPDLGRVDIYIKSRHFLIIIEAKTGSIEQDNQIERYQSILTRDASIYGIPEQRTAIVFLTVSGSNPKTGKVRFSISWKDIAQSSKMFSMLCANDFVAKLVNQYASFIARSLSIRGN